MMKFRVLTLALIITQVLTLQSFARKADMEKEAERYIRQLLRQVPELAGSKNSRDARESLLAVYKKNDILELSADMREKIEDRENPVPDTEYKAAILKLQDTSNKTKETAFILKKASEEKVDGELRLILFRLMEHHIDIDLDIRKNTLTRLINASRAYKNDEGKYAETLAELNLDQEIAQYKDKDGKLHDWIYLGGSRKAITRSSSRLLFIEPIADNSGNALAVNSRGSRTTVNLAKIKEEMQQSPAKPITPKKPSTTPKKTTSAKTGDYPKILEQQMKDIMLIYLSTYAKSKKAPTSLRKLPLPPHLIKATSPDNKSTLEWIFIPPSSDIYIEKSKAVLASPFSHATELHFITTDDGKTHTITTKDLNAILEKVKK